MIFDAIIEFFMTPIRVILEALPTIDVSIPTDIMDNIIDAIRLVGYVVPIGTISTIIGIKLAMWGVRITMALIVRIKSFIPTMGS